MKTLQQALLTLTTGIMITATAQAAVNFENGQTGQPYVGVKAGQFMIDADGYDDPTAVGVYAGYNFDSNFGAEIEYVGSEDADWETGYYGIDGEFDLKTYGAYGTYRYAFPNTGLYAKGKLGFAKAEIEASATNNAGRSYSASDSDSGVAGGIGLGYTLNPNVAFEAEYDYVAEDVSLLTLGANFKF